MLATYSGQIYFLRDNILFIGLASENQFVLMRMIWKYFFYHFDFRFFRFFCSKGKNWRKNQKPERSFYHFSRITSLVRKKQWFVQILRYFFKIFFCVLSVFYLLKAHYVPKKIRLIEIWNSSITIFVEKKRKKYEKKHVELMMV